MSTIKHVITPFIKQLNGIEVVLWDYSFRHSMYKSFLCMTDDYLEYVSSVDSKGYPTGYDKSKEYALNLSEWHLKRVTSYFNDIGAKWTESLS